MKFDGVEGQSDDRSVRAIDTFAIHPDGTATLVLFASCTSSRLCRTIELDAFHIAAQNPAPPQPPIFGEWSVAGVDLDGKPWSDRIVLRPSGSALGVYEVNASALSPLIGREVSWQLIAEPALVSCSEPSCGEAPDGFTCVPTCSACTSTPCDKSI